MKKFIMVKSSQQSIENLEKAEKFSKEDICFIDAFELYLQQTKLIIIIYERFEFFLIQLHMKSIGASINCWIKEYICWVKQRNLLNDSIQHWQLILKIYTHYYTGNDRLSQMLEQRIYAGSILNGTIKLWQYPKHVYSLGDYNCIFKVKAYKNHFQKIQLNSIEKYKKHMMYLDKRYNWILIEVDFKRIRYQQKEDFFYYVQILLLRVILVI